jgi:hypothetical protein
MEVAFVARGNEVLAVAEFHFLSFSEWNLKLGAALTSAVEHIFEDTCLLVQLPLVGLLQYKRSVEPTLSWCSSNPPKKHRHILSL